MLSPHEFATLMLVRHAPDRIDMNRAELDALLERQLVMLEHCGEGARRAYLTRKGKVFLETVCPSDAACQRGELAINDGGSEPVTPGVSRPIAGSTRRCHNPE
ncbi:hypothetical protein [Paraburkholderia tropica]|uniref:hypothetical protein n=1 Tax=Paraburkholderia tropica TaxID=92647 RepID=UPI0007EE08BA|nr:hypothetical protein [Paraburkholderia tropica]OBR46146.1 hypothetical protein A6456_37785 [Paraburkholderia tropica]